VTDVKRGLTTHAYLLFHHGTWKRKLVTTFLCKIFKRTMLRKFHVYYLSILIFIFNKIKKKHDSQQGTLFVCSLELNLVIVILISVKSSPFDTNFTRSTAFSFVVSET